MVDNLKAIPVMIIIVCEDESLYYRPNTDHFFQKYRPNTDQLLPKYRPNVVGGYRARELSESNERSEFIYL